MVYLCDDDAVPGSEWEYRPSPNPSTGPNDMNQDVTAQTSRQSRRSSPFSPRGFRSRISAGVRGFCSSCSRSSGKSRRGCSSITEAVGCLPKSRRACCLFSRYSRSLSRQWCSGNGSVSDRSSGQPSSSVGSRSRAGSYAGLVLDRRSREPVALWC